MQLSSQTMHTIMAGNFFYDPSALTIQVGDTVQWMNTEGFHNVNADVSTTSGESFGNPESFASEATSEAILLTRVFTVPGVYSYDCAVGNHAEMGMVAMITVLEAGPALHTINAGNFFFDPDTLTIEVGDTIQWINTEGFHNVNADISTLTGESFNNPESFASDPTSDAILLTRVFTIPGVYNYDCAVGNHAEMGMVGTFIVTAAPAFHTVNAGNFFFDPDTLFIAVGDTVQWINTEGFHNVNADISTLTGESFNNPESFASDPTSDAILLTRVFTVPGVYNYDCAVGNHAEMGMVGTLVVGNDVVTSVENTPLDKIQSFKAFYNSANGQILVEYGLDKGASKTSVSLHDLNGRILHQEKFNSVLGYNTYSINLTRLPAGHYFVRLFVDGSVATRKVYIH